MTDVALISIVLATHNGEKYLKRQLDSVFAQTYLNIEIIATDDGSSDNTISLLHHYAAIHSNLKVFLNETNLGFVKNFQKGCELSSGEYIAFCDQDDYWHPDKIKRMAESIGGYAMVYCDSFICNDQLEQTGKKISDIVVCQSFYNCLQEAIFCRIYGHATLIKKSLAEKAFPFLDVIPHDWWLSYIATMHGGIKYLDEPLVYYRQHQASLFGVVGTKRKKKHAISKSEKNRLEIEKIRVRISAFYRACPQEMVEEKLILRQLTDSYERFSLKNNFMRMILFFKHHKLLLAVKKRSLLRKYLFCIKMFIAIK